MTELLIKHRANPDLPAPRDVPCYACRCQIKASPCQSKVNRGTRALHCAVRGPHPGIIKTLFLAGADPNVADCEGTTPLMMACFNLEVVKELLEAGANPALTSKRESVALFSAAQVGSTAVVGMLLSKAPGTLNHTCSGGTTPLYWASFGGNEDVVAFLLAAGAQQPTAYESTACPLNASVQEGHTEVVRMLLHNGLEAIGGAVAIPTALATAVHTRRAGVLQIIIDMAHVEGRLENWTTCSISMINRPLVCCAVIEGDLTSLSVLLAAGADATATDSKGKHAQDVIHYTVDGASTMKAAFRRMLERAPAFRCHIWAWPANSATIGDACALSCADEVVRSGERRASLGVRVFRQKNRKLFARVVGGRFLCST